jgi:hypothetical protein
MKTEKTGMDKPVGKLEKVFIWAICFALVILVGYGMSAREANAQDACVSFDSYVAEVKEGAGEYVLIEVARDLRGAAAVEWADMTGWAGDPVARAVLLIAIDDRNGMVYVVGLVLLMSPDDCVLATATFQSDEAAKMMTTLQEKHEA